VKKRGKNRKFIGRPTVKNIPEKQRKNAKLLKKKAAQKEGSLGKIKNKKG